MLEVIAIPEQTTDPSDAARVTVASAALHGAELLPPAEVDRSAEIFRLGRNPETYEVSVESDITLADCEADAGQDWELLKAYAERVRGQQVVFINPTMEGGGVAMMRPPLVHKLRLLGVDAHWYVMSGERKDPSEPSPFNTTKLMHNIIQRRTDERLDESGKAIHQAWNAENLSVLEQQETIQTANIIVIDDPQPAPLIPGLKAVNPHAKFVWRNHIDNDNRLMNDPTTPQGEVWQYLRDSGLDLVDAFVFHPDIHDRFVPSDVHEKTSLMPATIEPRDDMNRELSQAEVDAGIAAINDQIRRENAANIIAGNLEDVQEQIDPNRDSIVLIARFDESKGMDHMMRYGALVREMLLARRKELGLPAGETPQIILIGNGSVDDPSGTPMLKYIRGLRRELPEDVRKDFIVQRLAHNYAAINAVMYPQGNAVLIGAQMSEAEGCETRISDFHKHGVPTEVANRGGMPLQVIQGESGDIFDLDRLDEELPRIAALAVDMIMDRTAYAAMKQRTLEAYRRHNSREYTTTANLIRWLGVFNGALTGNTFNPEWRVAHMELPSEVGLAA